MICKKLIWRAVLFLRIVIIFCASNPESRAGAMLGEADPCDSVSVLKLPHAIITQAQTVPAGDYLAPDGKTYSVPALCRVHGVSMPTQDSHINFEVWMPVEIWSGRYYQLGTGGFAGDIAPFSPQLVAFINKGSAVAITDTGHEGEAGDASWALNQPEKIIDYGYRSQRETTDKAKRIISAFYGREPDYSYFSGCSNGGRDAIIQAHRYPEEWDGMLIGAPANNWIRVATSWAWSYHAFNGNSRSSIPLSKLSAVQSAALASCSAEANVVEGIAADPRFCRLDTTDLICKGGETDRCLTVAQAEALKKIYEGPRNPRTGKQLYPGVESTFENQGRWANTFISAEGGVRGTAYELFSNIVFDDPDWDVHSLDYDKHIDFASSKDIAGERLSDALSIVSPDFKKMREKNSKIIMYHGWGDVAISAKGAIQDYERVVEKEGGLEKTQDFYRLFMVPGMLHCYGGSGANSFGQLPSAPGLRDDAEHDIHRALEVWVEQGVAPTKVTAAKYVNNKPDEGVAFTRPICPYPKVPVYNGRGSVDDADSFECRLGASFKEIKNIEVIHTGL